MIEKRVNIRQREGLTSLKIHSLDEECMEIEMKTGGEIKNSIFPARLIQKNSNSN